MHDTFAVAPPGRRRRRARTWALLGLALLGGAQGGAAQVLQVEDDGSVRRIGAGWPAADATDDHDRPPLAAVPHRYRAALEAAAAETRLSVQLLQALAWSESAFDPAAVSPAGAIGLMQLMPQTAQALGVDPRDPQQNILGGARYLRQQLDRFDGDLERALAAYNAGPAQVERHGGVPPFRETRAYVAANLERLAGLSLAAAPTPSPSPGGVP